MDVSNEESEADSTVNTTTDNSDTELVAIYELDQDSSDMDETVELEDTLRQFDPLHHSNGAPEGNFVNLSIVEAAQNSNTTILIILIFFFNVFIGLSLRNQKFKI